MTGGEGVGVSVFWGFWFFAGGYVEAIAKGLTVVYFGGCGEKVAEPILPYLTVPCPEALPVPLELIK